ncbi:Sec-independent protein translocase subunit TatA/TatB [Fulvivirga sediminis]|uniref:Sec-independent protein translocase protein TatA n=1 Tax=Fulvivirga sediminis TaxID=2803949 RepID=A0A937F515_9BACT|nr:twin-arginine translocase TatA/TatE family subunit [Fulvivirga sediminis]MBL3655027.1 twin-arginine translocase TatA/TatE family subunit [Fulvivirga sediminis]
MNSMLAFMPGGWEWVVIILVVLIFFGAKKIPELARGLGRGIREFKDATNEIKRDIDDSSRRDEEYRRRDEEYRRREEEKPRDIPKENVR